MNWNRNVQSARTAGARRALNVLIPALAAGEDAFAAAARALQMGSGWRWSAVTRLLPEPAQVRTLAWLEGAEVQSNFTYDLRGTPCEIVSRDAGFCFFQDVQSEFATDLALRRLNARVYAGLLYLDPDGRPIGHLFVLHDGPAANREEVEEVLQLVQNFIGAALRLTDLEERAARYRSAARTDALTGLLNRRAFSEDLRSLESICQEYGGVGIAVLDLDGMKAINDARGHEAGDRMLALLGSSLRRELNGSTVYRLGGDEFAVLQHGSAAKEETALRTAVQRTILHLREEGFPEIGASLGFASCNESGGEARSALRLADQRMYACKRRQKAERSRAAAFETLREASEPAREPRPSRAAAINGRGSQASSFSGRICTVWPGGT